MNSTFTHHKYGKPRNPAIVGLLGHFVYAHLPVELHPIGKRFCELAVAMADELAGNRHLTRALCELIEAWDDIVHIFKGTSATV